jgi:fluoride ion exporter CrcB/FEX
MTQKLSPKTIKNPQGTMFYTVCRDWRGCAAGAAPDSHQSSWQHVSTLINLSNPEDVMKNQKQWELAPKLTVLVGLCIMAVMFLSFSSQATVTIAHAGPATGPTPPANTPYFTATTSTTSSGQNVTKYNINGPANRPGEFSAESAAAILPATAKTLSVPAYNWVFGCSSVSGAMIAGYYDNNGYPNIYTGPANGGVAPMDNSVWGSWSDGVTTYPNLPLAASHNGVDGRTTNGSIDDYWVEYGSSAPDPYITGSWTQHTWGTAIGDYMKTSQSAYGNTDGSTNFYNWTTSAAPLTCADMVTNSIQTLDGTYGRKLFYEARGYTVTDCYNQKTDNNGGGFTFAMYKAQIDANRPVMLNLAGHTIVGVGYDDATSTVYIHDTWDYLTHSFIWGTSYAGMDLLSVSIVNLQAAVPPFPIPTAVLPTGTITDNTPSYLWTKVAGATYYRYYVYKGAALVYAKTVLANACTTACLNTPTTPLLYHVAYKWRVQALVGGVWGPFSAFKTFLINSPLLPKPGRWLGAYNYFYVSASQTIVTKFTVGISVPACGISGTITRGGTLPIVSKKFSFTGTFYATGAFANTLRASGIDGLSRFYIAGCGYVSGGPWRWSTAWKSATMSAEVVEADATTAAFHPGQVIESGLATLTINTVEP